MSIACNLLLCGVSSAGALLSIMPVARPAVKPAFPCNRCLVEMAVGAEPSSTVQVSNEVLQWSWLLPFLEESKPLEQRTPLSEQPTPLEQPTPSEQLVGEMIGTFLLTLAIASAGAQQLPMPTAPLAVASVLTGLIYAFGPLSGAIFNPAVSVAFWLRGRMPMRTVLSFSAGQTVAAFAAGLLGRLMYGKSVVPTVLDAASALGWTRAALAEVFFTGTIIQAVLQCATTKAQQDNPVCGVAIGFTLFGCAVCSACSGACFNPAIGLGLWFAKAMVREGFSWACAMLYLVAPIVGAVLSTAAFKASRPREP